VRLPKGMRLALGEETEERLRKARPWTDMQWQVIEP
jgi:hypothetical protein